MAFDLPHAPEGPQVEHKTGERPDHRHESAGGLAMAAACAWASAAIVYINAAEPYGRHLSDSEFTEATLWVLLPAAGIFVLIYLWKRSAFQSSARPIAVAFDSWAKDRQRKELKEFVEALRAMDAQELGLPIALATNFRNAMRQQGVDLSDPAMLVNLNPGIVFEISRKVSPLQKAGRTIEAVPLIIWVHSLRGVTRLELRGLAREMWRQLQRGFKYVDEAASDYAALTGEELDVSGATEFPKGLTPDPLD